jgi:hypothetical protein
LVTHFKVGNSVNEIPNDVIIDIAGHLLLMANDAEQKAQQVMSTPAADCVDAMGDGRRRRATKNLSPGPHRGPGAFVGRRS